MIAKAFSNKSESKLSVDLALGIRHFALNTLTPPTGAVASMFWVDAELGSDIYLDGKRYVMMQVCTLALLVCLSGFFDFAAVKPITHLLPM